MNCFTVVSFICRFPMSHKWSFLKMLCLEWTLTFLLRLLSIRMFIDPCFLVHVVVSARKNSNVLMWLNFTRTFTLKKIVSLCILISVAVLFLIFFNFILLIDTLQIAHVLKNTYMTPDSFYRTDWFSFYLTKGFFIYIACTNDFCLNCKVKWNNTQARFRNAPFLISKQGFKYDFC